MNARALRLLLEGAYICNIRYRDEFTALEDSDEQDEVNDWLAKVNMRLARLGETGAFFMAPAYIGAREVTQVRAELLSFRNKYGPHIQMLDLIRQAGQDNIMLAPGEYIARYSLEEAVSQSTMLEGHLKSLINVISGAAQSNSVLANLQRLLDHLTKDGYLVLVNKDTGTYQVCGKIEQIYAVLQFLSDHRAIPDSEVDDQAPENEEGDLVDLARGEIGLDALGSDGDLSPAGGADSLGDGT